ncbi:MAG: acyltransferase [Bacteroidales bacterium]
MNIALEIFRYQAINCPPYAEYIHLTGNDPDQVKDPEQIPFLPISIFKNREVITGNKPTQKLFTSSSTTGMIPARHYVTDLDIYEESFKRAFRMFLGEPSDYTILALLPSYLEREGSSLVYMADRLIKDSGSTASGFYLYNFSELYDTLCILKAKQSRTILLGVSFALLEFAERFNLVFPELTIVETGGMKGRGKEVSRNELHKAIKSGFGVKNVWSEYGMAELMSQAWSQGEGLFKTPPWMDIQIRDLLNPFKRVNEGITGGINIIDLANINSCSFIETEDLGVKEAGNTFSVLGRIQNSELRGCNILLEK